MKKTTIVIDSDDDDDGCRRFTMNAISQYSSAMSEEIDVPIICLDDDDDEDNDLNIDKEDYMVFLDQLRDDELGPLFEPNASGLDRPIRYEDDSRESDTRKFNMVSGDSKRAKLENHNPMNMRVFQEGKRKNVEISRGRTRESIERDNRIAERRKRRIAELEAERTLRDVPISIAEEDIRRDKKVRKISELMVETIPLITTQEDIQRDNKARKVSVLNVETLRDVPIRTQEDIQLSQGRKKKTDELMVETLRSAARLVRIEEEEEEDVLRDNRIAEPRNTTIVETKALNETSMVVPMEAVNRVTELKDVDETSSIGPVTQRNKGVGVGRRSVAIVDKDYMSYLTWLVDSLKEDSTTKPMPNLSDFDPPITDTLKESTIVPEKDELVKVKVEPDIESCWSDDPDIIEIGDSPFLDGEGTPFVVSKSMIEIDKKDESSSRFRKELMDDLRRPYDERELWKLSGEASIHKRKTRSRELRKGREADYETEDLAPSYLDRFTDFNEKYERVKGVDNARALTLLRGFFFYLTNVARDGAFKPWELD